MEQEKLIGKIIGNYKINSIIGQGAYSSVYLAEEKFPTNDNKIESNDKKNTKKQLAACKVISIAKIEAKNSIERLENEIKIHQLMHHPNVVQLIDVQKDSSNYYIFLEYCSNGELYNIIKKNRNLKESEAKPLFKQILLGLQYIHSINVAHRDLKPENILVDAKGHIKISDFGLSKLLDSQNDGLTSTPCGSPCYASPECISGNPYDAKKSDIWSCGVILYTMTTGYIPWTKKTQSQIFEQIKNAEFKIPSNISDLCSGLISRMMTVDNNKRITIKGALNHPFLKRTMVPSPKVDRKFVSLRKVDRILGKDVEFEYKEMINHLTKEHRESDSECMKSFFRVRKDIDDGEMEDCQELYRNDSNIKLISNSLPNESNNDNDNYSTNEKENSKKRCPLPHPRKGSIKKHKYEEKYCIHTLAPRRSENNPVQDVN